MGATSGGILIDNGTNSMPNTVAVPSKFVEVHSYSFTPSGGTHAFTIVTYQDGKNPGKFWFTITNTNTSNQALSNRSHSSEQRACQAAVFQLNAAPNMLS